MTSPIRPYNLTRQISVTDSFAQQSRTALRRDIASLSEQLSTGRRINRPSDDAGGFEQARQLEAYTNEIQQHQRSIDASTHWVNTTQDTLDGIVEQFAEAYERGVQGANDTLNTDERKAIANDLRSIKDTVISELNTKIGDEYLFAGNATQDAPFNPTTGEPTAGANDYSRIDGERTRFVGPGQKLKINMTGQEIHEVESGESIVDALDGMIDALDPPTPFATPADQQNAIQTALGDLEQARDHVIDRTAEAGNIARRLEIADTRLDDMSLRADARRSEIEDVDLAEALTELQSKQTNLQAALKVTATVKQTSLIDFL
jgi:flagellar hook-associated protein 3 FlgL